MILEYMIYVYPLLGAASHVSEDGPHRSVVRMSVTVSGDRNFKQTEAVTQ